MTATVEGVDPETTPVYRVQGQIPDPDRAAQDRVAASAGQAQAEQAFQGARTGEDFAHGQCWYTSEPSRSMRSQGNGSRLSSGRSHR